ncbi:unnamed protein product [Calicophoron daubneyi]
MNESSSELIKQLLRNCHNRKKSSVASDCHDSLTHLIRQPTCSRILRQPRRRLSELLHVERHSNGGGYALHSYVDELSHLSSDDLNKFARKYFRILFTEKRKEGISVPFSRYCIGVIHGASTSIPELLSYLSQVYPSLQVTTNPLGRRNDTECICLSEYASRVYQSYMNGIYRSGPLHAISIVGVRGEERGCFSKNIVEMLDSDPFLRLVTPWGIMSKLFGMSPQESNDGPIIWARHGEQLVPVCRPSTKGRKRGVAGSTLADLLSSRRTTLERQILVHDRTPCHADHVDDGLRRHTTAAIGVLKAIYPPKSNTCSPSSSSGVTGAPKVNPYSVGPYTPGRIVKDVVLFDPRHYPDLVRRLGLDIMEPPASQCSSFWADDAELNQLRTEGFRYVRLPLRDNDFYFIPRNVVHQFKTVSAVVSIAWHSRLKMYYVDEKDSAASSCNPMDPSSLPSARPVEFLTPGDAQ